MGGRRKKTDVWKEDLVEDDNLGHTGRPKRSRMGAADRGRYGSADVTISSAMSLSRDVVKDCQRALGLLATQKAPIEDVCRCPHNYDQRRPGATLEDAVEIDDDDDDEVEVLAFTARPLLAKKEMRTDELSGKFIEEGILTADDIMGHQKIRESREIPANEPLVSVEVQMEDVQMKEARIGEVHVEEVQMKEVTMKEVQPDKENYIGIDGDFLIKSLKGALKEVSLEAKSALKSLKSKKGAKVGKGEKVEKAAKGGEAEKVGKGGKRAKKASLKEKSPPTKGGRAKGDNVDEGEEDDLEEPMFGSPKHKKLRDTVFAEVDEDGPDYEVELASDSDREPTPEVEDPFDEIWKECAVMARLSKAQNDDKESPSCVHVFEIKNDVGRACSLCGLIKEDIKDMSFVWRRPCTVRKAWVRGERIDNWDADGDEMLVEETKLVGMSQLEAHPSLEDSMHPHQLEGFKFLSRNLVEEDSGGCMLAFAPGTGKSFLVISFIQSFMVQVPNARPMIVAPKSMLRPWMQEFKKWQVEEQVILNLYEAEDQVEMLKQWQETNSVLLVGYSQCTNMSGEVGKYLTEGPGLLVLDEGHLARTESTKILKSLSRVHTKRRVLLSGTPFNNNFEEFYTTLELVRPNFMMRANAQMCPTLNTLMTPELNPLAGSPMLKRPSNAGRQAFKDVIGEKFESGKHDSIAKALQQLRMLIAPFVAWHKGQILETLPGITDLTVMLELSLEQRELLKNDRSEVRDNLQKRAAAIYVHPILEPVLEHGKRSQKDPRLKGDIDVKQGVKLRWVLDLVQLCDDAKEKVLIFSEYLYSLALIENMTMQRMKWIKGTQILRLDGAMPPQERERIVNKFNSDKEVRMLCASIKACGEGISLVGASRVVILEVLWNPAVTRQAISRAFRIGQQKKVVVYRLIAADSYEEHRMHATATRKEWLSKLLFDPTISCEDPNSILWDVTNNCSDTFFDGGPLRTGLKKILEREF